ncbi:uncharacterized protein LOC111047636 [Nilaparvata lugens]|uniref:uncharacterized protein LOC111047636 n=1 Tax=Nilaparvata lugens TaxID=108931 RepID=UPI00193E1EB5|nr:uncharacterized protein LOC111047636 [Nilaparvata lugens]
MDSDFGKSASALCIQSYTTFILCVHYLTPSGRWSFKTSIPINYIVADKSTLRKLNAHGLRRWITSQSRHLHYQWYSVYFHNSSNHSGIESDKLNVKQALVQ